MIDPEASRRTAHLFLDAAAVQHQDDDTNFDERDDMVALILERPLAEAGAIQLEQDDDGHITVDIRRLQTGVLAVITALLEGWASCAQVDRDLIIADVRRIIDEHITDDERDD